MVKIVERQLISNEDLPSLENQIKTFETEDWLLEQFFVVTLPMKIYFALIKRIVPQ